MGREGGDGKAGPEGFDAQVTFCYTPDLEGTARFYQELLGLPLALDQGSCRIYRVARGAFLGFCRRETAPRPDGVILTLVTDDVEGWHAKLTGAGTVCEQPPTYNPTYDITHAFFRDPGGYRLEIQRFHDPRWPSPRTEQRGGRAAADSALRSAGRRSAGPRKACKSGPEPGKA